MKTIKFSKKGSINAQYEFPKKCSYTHLHLRIKQETSAQPQHKERKYDSILLKNCAFSELQVNHFTIGIIFHSHFVRGSSIYSHKLVLKDSRKIRRNLPVIRYMWLSCFCLSRSHHRTQQIDRLRNKGGKPLNSLRWPIYVFNTVDIT